MICEALVVLKPTGKEAKNGEMEKILAGPTVIVAKDLESAKLQMAIASAEVIKGADQERVEVLVRPF